MHNLCMAGKDEKAGVDPVAALSGSRIRSFREANGWTQGELAARTGWDEDKSAAEQPHVLALSRISNYEQGLRRVGFEEAEILARIFNWPAAYFMGAITDDEARILITFRETMPPTQPREPPRKSERTMRRSKRA